MIIARRLSAFLILFIILGFWSYGIAADGGLAPGAFKIGKEASASHENQKKTEKETSTTGGSQSASADEDDGEKVDGAGGNEPLPSSVDQAWETMWSGQNEMLQEIRATALKLSDSFSKQTENLSQELQPFEKEGRRLLVFINTFKSYPNALEVVSRRISGTIQDIQAVLEPVTLARAEAQALLERVNSMSANLPDDQDRSRFSPEMQEYLQDITKARLRLTAVQAQYDSLLPSLGLIQKLKDAQAQIAKDLPGLWERYYIRKPVAWLNPDLWINLKQDLSYAGQACLLRLPVEMPTTSPQWSTAAIRFVIGLLFMGILTFLLKKKWLHKDSSAASRHIFDVSAPWIVFGLSLLGSALSSTGDFFRLFLAIGSFSLIVGQISLAWDLRRLQFPKLQEKRSPFLRFLPMAICGYLLLYLPLTPVLALITWTILLIVSLICLRRPVKLSPDMPTIERGALDCRPFVLWIALFLSVSGVHIYSIGLYLAFVAMALGVQMSVAGIAIVSRINEHLPQEGIRAALARLLVALAAPFVLIVVVATNCLWGAILPGGTYLLEKYALKGISVGATQFNIIQILLIISVFYITRTVVAMGTRFLAKLPRQGVRFDATLITPMQTALTYTAWAIFGLFVLRSLGMELSSLAVVAGGLSVGIGFGMQTIVNNFISGLILIFGRTLQVGDVVEVGNTTGRVRKISVRATMVETYDNAIIFVPNSEFMAGRLVNWTSFSRSVRAQIAVGVAYGSNTRRVIELLTEIAKEHENVLQFPGPSVNFADFGASTLDFQLRFWVKDYDLVVSTSSDIRLSIDKVFAENGIEIAFPQLDVHLKELPPAKSRPKALPRPASPVTGQQSVRPRVAVSAQRPRIRARRPAQGMEPRAQSASRQFFASGGSAPEVPGNGM